MKREIARVALKKIFHGLVYAFAAIGFVFVAVFFAIRLQWTNVSGKIDERSSRFFERQAVQARVLGESTQAPEVADVSESDRQDIASLDAAVQNLSKRQQARKQNLCSIKALKSRAAGEAKRIRDAQMATGSEVLTFKMLSATRENLMDQDAFDAEVRQCADAAALADEEAFLGPWDDGATGSSVLAWANDEEWGSLAPALAKDKDVITAAARTAGIEPRLLAASFAPEQMRLFHSQRELFKKFFEPLKILGNSTTISLGVIGMKPPTAEAVERHLKDPSSPYYLGPQYEHLLDYPEGVDPEKERYNRLTDEKDRSYCYLYGALYLKQMLRQWQDAGYDIQYRPEIVGTLFNVGFAQSRPKPDPQVGGSTIRIGEREYSFGRLAYEFYYSGMLAQEFPYEVK
jgi:hypothetical protein